ncbi:D-amino-acid oxidase [Penicillium malachiteum]|uniref:D-amino-acid oxidase n=1 Tax=Penicillium malachiteum TaxID=1324776 RepID=A0AAD6MVA4_9EURO|nr:D-amino-acid oxidase [Penicillium malachiteum]
MFHGKYYGTRSNINDVALTYIRVDVSGLTTAYMLSKDADNKITVLAKRVSGDYDVEYASPWTCADYLPFGKEGSNQREWERDSWPVLKEIAERFPEAVPIFLYLRLKCVLDSLIYQRKNQGHAASDEISKAAQPYRWYADVVPNKITIIRNAQFKPISQDKLPPDIDGVQSFTSICINTAIYLSWLLGQSVKNGYIAQDAVAHHSGEKADVVVNCTWLSSKFLLDVCDDKLYPDWGQIVIFRNDPGSIVSVSESETGDSDAKNEVTYIMTRTAGGVKVIGGSHHKHDWNALPDPSLANRILQSAIAICPQLVKRGQGIEGLDIVRHGVGLRPVSDGGRQIEKDEVEGVSVVHNYGHGGFGYQSSFGCAAKAISLVEEVLSNKRQVGL